MNNAGGLGDLGLAVRQRRHDRGWTQDDVVARGGPSDKILTRIENNRPPAPSFTTQAKLDTALEWVRGSAAAVLAGGEPTPLEDVVTPEVEANTDEGDDVVQRHIKLGLAFEHAGVTSIMQRGAASQTGRGMTFSPEVIDELIEVLNSVPGRRASTTDTDSP